MAHLATQTLHGVFHGFSKMITRTGDWKYMAQTTHLFPLGNIKALWFQKWKTVPFWIRFCPYKESQANGISQLLEHNRNFLVYHIHSVLTSLFGWCLGDVIYPWYNYGGGVSIHGGYFVVGIFILLAVYSLIFNWYKTNSFIGIVNKIYNQYGCEVQQNKM